MANDLIDTIIMEAKTHCNMDQWIQVFVFVCLCAISAPCSSVKTDFLTEKTRDSQNVFFLADLVKEQ